MKLFRSLFGAVVLGCFLLTVGVNAQRANSISGHVFNPQRLPLEGITVELLDDFGRTQTRVRTSSDGRYFFDVKAGTAKYRVRVLPTGTDYLEATARIEIQNILRNDAGGAVVWGAFMNAQRDFYLRLDRRKHDPGRAETIFAQSVPRSAKALYEEGVELIGKKRKKEGYKKLIAAIEAFPDYYLAIEKLGLEYIVAKHYRAASILLQRAVQIHPKSYKGWYGLAYSYSSLKLNKDALTAAKNASTLGPGSFEAQFLTGRLLRLNGKFRESEKHFLKAKILAKNSDNKQIHWELALLYAYNLKQYDKAADELEAHLKINPNAENAAQLRTLIREFRQKSKRT